MLAIAQFSGRDGEALVFDGLGWAAIVGYVDASDIGLAAGAHVHILGPAKHSVDRDAAQRDSWRQRSDFEFYGLDSFRPGFVDRAKSDGILAGREFSRVDDKFQLIAADYSGHFRIAA